MVFAGIEVRKGVVSYVERYRFEESVKTKTILIVLDIYFFIKVITLLYDDIREV